MSRFRLARSLLWFSVGVCTPLVPAQIDVVDGRGAPQARSAADETPSQAPDQPLFGVDPNQPLDLRGHCSVSTARIGQRVVVTLDLFTADGVQGVFEPEVPEGFGGSVERLRPEPWPEDESKGTWRRYRLSLIPLRVGELSVPSFKVTQDGGEAVATSRPFDLLIEATRPSGDSAESEALPALGIPFRWPSWALPLAIGAALGAVLAWWLWRRWRHRPVKVAREVPVPAHVTALRELARLRKAPRGTPEEVDAYYVGVSDALRLYLEQRFGLHAPERTTEEFLIEVERDGAGALARRGFDTELRLGLGEFLRQCDLVKFARIDPGASGHDEVHRVAEQFVERTRADRVPESRVRAESPTRNGEPAATVVTEEEAT